MRPMIVRPGFRNCAPATCSPCSTKILLNSCRVFQNRANERLICWQGAHTSVYLNVHVHIRCQYSLISPGLTVTSSFGSQTWAHSGGGSRVHFFVPFIWACHDGFPTASICRWKTGQSNFFYPDFYRTKAIGIRNL